MLNLQALEGIQLHQGLLHGAGDGGPRRIAAPTTRALFVLAGTSAARLPAAMPRRSQLGDNWRRSGLVLNAWQQQGQVWLTAVLPESTPEADARFRLKQEEGSSPTLQPLPYPLADPDV